MLSVSKGPLSILTRIARSEQLRQPPLAFPAGGRGKEADGDPVMVGDERVHKLSEARDRLVNSQEDVGVVVEHIQLGLVPGVVRAKRVSRRQEPTSWTQDS